MADPVTWIIASAAVSAVGSIASSEAQAQQQEAASRTAQVNAQINAANAANANAAASANEDAQRRKSAQDMGRLRASLAENGIGLDSGTATDLVEQSAMNAELDALNIRYSGQQQARAYQQQSAFDTADAAQMKANASATRTSGYLTAGANALSAYGTYSGYKARLKNLPTA